MIDQQTITHHIQKHIIDVLMRRKFARFRDMRPPRIDSNAYSYHLTSLLKQGYITKADKGYTLSRKGLLYVDRLSVNSLRIRPQPKIITMLVVQNSNGDVLLYKRTKQPHIDTWTLPYGKLHVADESLQHAAKREVKEKLFIQDTISLVHAGDCYIRVGTHEGVDMGTMAHIFRCESDDIHQSATLQWARPHRLSEYDLAPAVEEIITRTFFRDPYFFEEYRVLT